MPLQPPLQQPPKFVNVPAAATYDLSLPTSVFRTLAMVHGLAWQHRGERLPPATVADLAATCGLKERQMYNHLRELRDRRLIRIENLGDKRIIIYPLRWADDEPTALGENPSDLSDDDLASLAAPQPTAIFCSPTAKDCSPKHVVVFKDSDSDSDSDLESEQQHEHGKVTAKNCSDLEIAIADVFVEDGATADQAAATARDLVQQYGQSRCQRQIDAFPARCERARASARGLDNPSGLLVRSIEGNWSVPTKQETTSNTWYSEEEKHLIQR